jgi:hypothetical protein
MLMLLLVGCTSTLLGNAPSPSTQMNLKDSVKAIIDKECACTQLMCSCHVFGEQTLVFDCTEADSIASMYDLVNKCKYNDVREEK